MAASSGTTSSGHQQQKQQLLPPVTPSTLHQRRPNLRPWPSNTKGPEPLPPDEETFTSVEKNAIKSLLDSNLLLYNDPDRTCPFDEVLPRARNAWDEAPMRPLLPKKFNQIVPVESRELPGLVEKFRDDLLLDVGADVVSGTIFALNIDGHDDEQEYFGHDPKKSEKENAKIPAPHDDPGSASAPLNLATKDFVIYAKSCQFTFPISEKSADFLTYGGQVSKFGVSGEGDHEDDCVRKSWEYNEDQLVLPPWLHHPRRFYPRLERIIKERLCPSTEKISIVPYKLVCYTEGSHFDQHRDSTNDPRHFGTLAIHLPQEVDFADSSPFENPEEFDWHNSSSSSEDDDGDDTAAASSSHQQQQIMKRGKGGALRFYLGRGIDPKAVDYGEELIDDGAIQNYMRGDYGRPSDSLSQLCGTVLMQNYTQDELEGKHPFVSASGNCLVEPFHRPDGRNLSRDEAIQEANGDESKLPPSLFQITKDGVREIDLARFRKEFSQKTNPPKKDFHNTQRQHTPLKFTAWLTDVYHQVRKLGSNSRRIVMTYKLLKNNYISPLRIPREISLVSQLERIASSFVAMNAKANAKTRERGLPRTFGFVLRHCYPVLSLAEPWRSLKSVDAVVYQIISSRFHCVLTPAMMTKDNEVGVPFFDDAQSARNVFLTSGLRSEVMDLLMREDARDKLHSHAPLICPVEWKELGFGNAAAANGIYGNWDCGKTWSYSLTALVCLVDEPSRWERRKVAFLIQEKGYDGNMFQRIGRYYPIFRNVCYFL